MESKKKNKLFVRVLLVFVIIFGALMVMLNSGYYEAKKRESIVLTEKEIKEYELKIASGEAIDLDSYIKKTSNDYSNTFSEAGENITNGIEKVMTVGIKTVFGVIKTLF